MYVGCLFPGAHAAGLYAVALSGLAEWPGVHCVSPLPCWADLSPEAYRNRVAGMVAEIEEAAAAERKRTGKSPLGAPLGRPMSGRRSLNLLW